MEHYSVILFLLALLIGLSAIAGKFSLPYPILLITAGIVVGFLPQVPEVKLDPEVVFLVFLPPLLYDSSFNISLKEFKANTRTISRLAIATVFITTTAVAVTAHYLIPGMSWPVSFVLGAILSPPDAVAAGSVTKGLGISHRTLTILEGESLINDASGLIAYKFALAAVGGTGFVFMEAGWQFLVLLIGGMLTGFVVGRILTVVLRKLRNNHQVVISLTLLAPFVTYELGEQLHVSGILAVVMMGFVLSRDKKKTFLKKNLEQSQTFWEVIVFILNGLVFLLIGMQFPYVLHNVKDAPLLQLFFYSFIFSIVLMAVRMWAIYTHAMHLKKRVKYFESKKMETQEERLHWKDVLIIGWSGMRGILSLAIALALPTVLENGQAFPERNVVVFITVTVVLITLVVQGIGLPFLVRGLKLGEEDKTKMVE